MARFLIAGAGIGGLTAALALAKAGAGVTLLERAQALEEAGAGIQLSPNATRILDRLGILDSLKGVCTAPCAIRVRNGHSGRLIALMPLADAEDRWGAPFLLARRADLQSSLAAAVAAEPTIALHLDTILAGFGTTDSSVKVAAKQARTVRTMEGDALIGADGIHSTVRARLTEGKEAPTETGRTAWRALIPAEILDPSFCTAEANLWLGRDAHLVHYPLDAGRRINVVAITRERAGPRADEWSSPGDAATLRARFSTWHATARTLIAAAPFWTTWPLYEGKAIAAWNAGRIALLGDAAHPILPFLAQGAAQAIEDAAALAAAFASRQEIPKALAAYSRGRARRVAQIQRTSRQLGRIYHLSGPEAAMRDMGMRLIGGRRLLHRYDWLYGA